jgi:hypothetical protein
MHQEVTGSLQPKWRVFTARYALSPYIKQIRFVFKGLTERLLTFKGLLMTAPGRSIPNIIYNYLPSH